MKSENQITHEGVILSSDPASVTVMISQNVSCAGCQASGVCNLNDRNNKILRIDGNYNLKPGSKVIVSANLSRGYLAVFLGYVMPFIILIASLLVAISMSLSELAAGLISLGITAFYYILLFLFRKHVSKKFSFSLKTL